MLKSFINYYGGKHRSAPMYPKPQCSRIIEPFAGAAGYSMRHYHLDVNLYDKDEYIVEMWDYLINASKADIMSLPHDVDDVTSLNVPIGAKYLIGFCLNTGTSQPSKTRSIWGQKYASGGQFWGEKRRERIANQVDLIKHWKIKKVDDYSEISNTSATWFIDPPYKDKGYKYRYGSSGINFEHLGNWCNERLGQIIVCEQEGATWLDFNNIQSVKSNQKTLRSNEVWLHRSSDKVLNL